MCLGDVILHHHPKIEKKTKKMHTVDPIHPKS